MEKVAQMVPELQHQVQKAIGGGEANGTSPEPSAEKTPKPEDQESASGEKDLAPPSEPSETPSQPPETKSQEAPQSDTTESSQPQSGSNSSGGRPTEDVCVMEKLFDDMIKQSAQNLQLSNTLTLIRKIEIFNKCMSELETGESAGQPGS
ncbi:hypothetical protein MHSWG343_06790 [Candidatus Mycoplasma haematohominis]|uniref:Uncharacterized protein n=1 Tax=Candidatus Mycoplasma haematohominis TaxID=1494318 RepID=A0A478FT72_9MOLU|nr:hypothetical protein MHSWG343_06790 [Candidatus Mycoplasma haemohominis]